MEEIDIQPGTSIEDMLERYPEAAGFFLRYGIKCFSCSGVLWGTVEEALRRKKVEDIEGTVAELRTYVAEHRGAVAAGESFEV